MDFVEKYSLDLSFYSLTVCLWAWERQSYG